MRKITECKYSKPTFQTIDKAEFTCIVNRIEDNKIESTNEDKCEKCTKFKSRYIQFPIEVSKLNISPIDNWTLSGVRVGDFVKIRPCADEYENKTFLGVFLGDLPVENTVSYNEKTQELNVFPIQNPAILVPELNKIIYGCASWWGKIESPDDLVDISNNDIDNIWYVKALKSLNK